MGQKRDCIGQSPVDSTPTCSSELEEGPHTPPARAMQQCTGQGRGGQKGPLVARVGPLKQVQSLVLYAIQLTAAPEGASTPASSDTQFED